MSVIEDMARALHEDHWSRLIDDPAAHWAKMPPSSREIWRRKAAYALRAALSGNVGDVLREVVHIRHLENMILDGKDIQANLRERQRVRVLASEAAAALPADILDMLREENP